MEEATWFGESWTGVEGKVGYSAVAVLERKTYPIGFPVVVSMLCFDIVEEASNQRPWFSTTFPRVSSSHI